MRNFLLLIFSISIMANDGCYQNVLDQLVTIKNPGNNLRANYVPIEVGLQGVTKKLLQLNAKFYIEALENGEPHAKHLYAMGFRFDPVEVPTLEQIVAYYHNGIERLIEQGKIAREDALFMSTSIQRNGEFESLRIGEEVDYVFVPVNGLLSTEEFYKALGKGNFPLAPANVPLKGAGEGQSLFMHDLAHFSAFLDHPEYMVALKKHTVQLHKILKVSTDKRMEMKLSNESFYLQEQLQVTRLDEYLKLRNQLNIPDEIVNNDFYDIKKLQQVYREMSPAELKALAAKVNDKYPELIENIGGAMRDFLFRGNHQDIAPGQIDVQMKALDKSLTHGQRAKNMAVLVSFLQGFSKIKLDEVVHSFDNLEIVKGSPLDRFIKESNIKSYFGTGPRAARFPLQDNPILQGAILGSSIVGGGLYYWYKDDIEAYQERQAQENSENSSQ